MKILVLSDVEAKSLWDYYQPGMLRGYDLILSCGDLSPHYLSFIETFANVPVLYVHGNHDEKYAENPPEGCFCIEDDIYVHEGIRILGLGGSMRYRPGTHQYSEKEMQRRIRRLWWKLRKHKGFDILLTHAPAADFHAGEDLCHQGFQAFRTLLAQYTPKYFIHGHVHMNYGLSTPRLSMLGKTVVINGYRMFCFTYDDDTIAQQAEMLREEI